MEFHKTVVVTPNCFYWLPKNTLESAPTVFINEKGNEAQHPSHKILWSCIGQMPRFPVHKQGQRGGQSLVNEGSGLPHPHCQSRQWSCQVYTKQWCKFGEFQADGGNQLGAYSPGSKRVSQNATLSHLPPHPQHRSAPADSLCEAGC